MKFLEIKRIVRLIRYYIGVIERKRNSYTSSLRRGFKQDLYQVRDKYLVSLQDILKSWVLFWEDINPDGTHVTGLPYESQEDWFSYFSESMSILDIDLEEELESLEKFIGEDPDDFPYDDEFLALLTEGGKIVDIVDIYLEKSLEGWGVSIEEDVIKLNESPSKRPTLPTYWIDEWDDRRFEQISHEEYQELFV